MNFSYISLIVKCVLLLIVQSAVLGKIGMGFMIDTDFFTNFFFNNFFFDSEGSFITASR